MNDVVNEKHTETSTKKRKIVTTLKRFFIIIMMLIVLFMGIFLVLANSHLGVLKGLDINEYKLNYTSTIYYIDTNTNEKKELIRLYEDENRIWINLNDMPKYLANAFIAIEDERFWQHSGVDIKRTLLATYNYIFLNKTSFGGSTITQQLIKNLTNDADISMKRKVKEIWQALILEKQMKKEKILELYLNVVYLGEGCNGVQTAAYTYFGKNAKDLTLAEAASIAAITQFPNKYDPFINAEENRKRQIIVLNKMLELKYINQQEYENARNESINFAKDDRHQTEQKYSSFIDAVISSVLTDLQKEKGYSKAMASKLLYTGGLKIVATVDPKVQDALEKVFYDDTNFPKSNNEIKPEAAAVILNPMNGHVVGLIGGREKNAGMRTLNRATQSVRQPGSAIKPISVYAPAIEYGVVTSNTVFDDAPFTIGNWSPKNWYNGYWGKVTVKTAVEQSINVVAVKTLEQVGLDRSFNFLRNNLGITTLVENENRNGKDFTDKLYPSLGLGGLVDGVTVMEIAGAYSPFVNKGIYIKPHVYSKIEDHNGSILIDNEKIIQPRNAMREQTAVEMTKLLTGVVTQGTATYARLSTKMPVAGKTGTTSDDKDRWFVGYTPYYVGAVWFGFDTPQSTTSILAGMKNPSVVLWRKTMEDIHKNLPIKEFENDATKGTENKGILHLPGNKTYEGEIKGSAANGFGMLTFNDGNRYIGQFSNNKMQGKGVLIYASGDRYEGDFKDDSMTGNGTFIWTSGDYYSGEWEDGKFNGTGTIKWINGDNYVGKFKDGKADGMGTMKWVSGDSYTGEWKNGEFDGLGTFVWKNGESYSGLWEKGKKSQTK